MDKKYTLDRIEGSIAVCVARDDGEIIECDANFLSGICEGDVFWADFCVGVPRNIRRLPCETEEVKKENKKRLNNLFNRGKGDNL